MKRQRTLIKTTALLLLSLLIFVTWNPFILATEGDPEDKTVDISSEDLIEDDYDEPAENIPPVMYDPPITIPQAKTTLNKRTNSNGGIKDTIEVNKTAERKYGECRTYTVTLDITGEPQEAPVDVVLIIDKSGSMNESTTSYKAITNPPTSGQSYYVKIDGSYQSVRHYSGTTWRYWNIWNPVGYRYVEWNSTGNDINHGSSSSSSPLGKPFYLRESHSRLHYAKETAINFAAKVLGDEGIPGSRVSLVTFNGPTTQSGSGNQNQAQTVRPLTSNLTQLTNDINGIVAEYGTNTEAGFLQGRGVIENSDNPHSNKVVIMFTDGLPTASNGNKYAESTDINDVHNQNAINAGKGIFEDGIADVFTIGLLQGMSTAERNLALQILDLTQNKDWYEAPTAADLDAIFQEIAGKLGYAAKDTKVVDKIGEHFNFVEGSFVPQTGASYDSGTQIINWNPNGTGTITEKTTLTYKVVAKSDFPGGDADTNGYATLTYTDVFGNEDRTKTFPVPKVYVPTLLEVKLTDAEIILGDSINLGIGTDPDKENYMGISGGDGNGNYTYEWKIKDSSEVLSTNENPTVSPTKDTTYVLTVTDSNNCIATAEMTVTVRKLKVTIKKFIEGNFADLSDTFKFDVWIGDNTTGTPNHTFTLGHNGEKILNDIAKGSTITLKEESGDYTVEVTAKDSDGTPITVTSSGDKKYYQLDVGSKDIIITVTNERSVEIDVGVPLDSLPYLLALFIAIAGLAFIIIRRHKVYS